VRYRGCLQQLLFSTPLQISQKQMPLFPPSNVAIIFREILENLYRKWVEIDMVRYSRCRHKVPAQKFDYMGILFFGLSSTRPEEFFRFR